jgi:hypothetical protein
VEVHEAAREAALADQLEVDPHAVGQRPTATGRSAASFMRRTASGSKLCSIRRGR